MSRSAEADRVRSMLPALPEGWAWVVNPEFCPFAGALLVRGDVQIGYVRPTGHGFEHRAAHIEENWTPTYLLSTAPACIAWLAEFALRRAAA